MTFTLLKAGTQASVHPWVRLLGGTCHRSTKIAAQPSSPDSGPTTASAGSAVAGVPARRDYCYLCQRSPPNRQEVDPNTPARDRDVEAGRWPGSGQREAIAGGGGAVVRVEAGWVWLSGHEVPEAGEGRGFLGCRISGQVDEQALPEP